MMVRVLIFFFVSPSSAYAILTSQTGMVDAVKELAKLHVDFTKEERNLFSVAYKNLIGGKRAAWRVINAVKGQEGRISWLFCCF